MSFVPVSFVSVERFGDLLSRLFLPFPFGTPAETRPLTITPNQVPYPVPLGLQDVVLPYPLNSLGSWKLPSGVSVPLSTVSYLCSRPVRHSTRVLPDTVGVNWFCLGTPILTGNKGGVCSFSVTHVSVSKDQKRELVFIRRPEVRLVTPCVSGP